MSTPRQGEVWWAQAEDKRRPVLVVTRDVAVPVLNRVVVAPVTRTVRAIPTEVPLGAAEGLPVDCAASFDNLQPISRTLLFDRIGSLGDERRREICRALDALADC
ncbi:type II toxin-antitoxin system PemK/MazF family toxin [Conexibacter stalactiti]|uniref:Type II toxin-antitoxin system PemK/MazF family toxin n=1 Tax=Conexibacter stalactiti TaxID=1940611 RepID=A0ABU4HU23_9ACTN|nr:type II toxin-antitoxin system PemK/MazF family toxin [Conexibacter stalactiti]MDW5596771.1 type II toxin-antitoxin system PemK/MazF family toxin [Conexibacter stalactiti]MEC5037413.1 type II toxin-antitoxin system PemK/MazF family toxin [Conexibacter stalactiti]